MGLRLNLLTPQSAVVKGSCAGPLAPAMLCRAALGLQSPQGKAVDSLYVLFSTEQAACTQINCHGFSAWLEHGESHCWVLGNNNGPSSISCRGKTLLLQ